MTTCGKPKTEHIATDVQVPVIVDPNQDGKWVNDSWAIAKYLEETYPDRPSLFGGPQGACCNLSYNMALHQEILLCILGLVGPPSLI